MKPIDIVITTWNREWMTQACIDRIKNNTRIAHRIILIDNGSKFRDQAVFLQESDIYIKLDKNYGLEYAKNLGMQFVESELFVSMDNDILVYKYDDIDWLQRLINLMYTYPEYAALGCKPQILVGTGMYMFETKDEVVPFHHVPGYARLMRTDCVNQTGAWSDKRSGRGHEELWIGDEFEKRGWKMGWANFVECIHLWGKGDSKDIDGWGYKQGIDSGHSPVWPMPTNDKDFIMQKTGVYI